MTSTGKGLPGNALDREHAETIALRALAYTLSTPSQASRFLDQTGFTPAEIQARADTREVLEAVLATLLNDEAALMVFAANNAIDPQDVVRAHACLSAAA